MDKMWDSSNTIETRAYYMDKYTEIYETNTLNSVNDVVKRIVNKYCGELDKYMQFVKSVIQDKKTPPNTLELDDFALNIPLYIYFVSEGQEKIGLSESITKELFKECYNEKFKEAVGTVAERKAKAELDAQYEQLNHLIYQSAYKQIKSKVDAAQEVLNSVKKVIGRREAEYNLSRKVRS